MRHFTGRQQEILDAAINIIAELGMQRMTIKNLARAVQVSEPAVYRHFNSKYHILSSILLYYRRLLLDVFGRKPEPGSAPMDSIQFLYDGLFKIFRESPQLSMIQFSDDLFRHDRRLSREALGIVDLMHGTILAIVRTGAQSGKIRPDIPPKQIAWMVMGTMRMLIVRWRMSGYSFDLSREGRQIFDYLRKMLLP